jgi:hypothetical protein
MARPSKIDRLPPEIREEIGRLRDKGRTLDEIMAALRGLDAAEDISRSGLGRYVQRIDRMGERLRRSRQMAEALARQLGDQPGDQVARLNIEALHSFLSDALLAADEDGEQGDATRAVIQSPMGAKLFAEALERLSKAQRLNQDFVEKMRRQVAEEAQRNAASAVEKEGRAQGLSNATIAKIKATIFGLKAPA